MSLLTVPIPIVSMETCHLELNAHILVPVTELLCCTICTLTLFNLRVKRDLNKKIAYTALMR